MRRSDGTAHHREVSELKRVQEEVRRLARRHEWFAKAVRRAVRDMEIFDERNRREWSEYREQERALARELLKRGLLVDPKTEDCSPCTFFQVEGLCPVNLADRLVGWTSIYTAPKGELGREAAAWALSVLDRKDRMNRPGLSKKELHRLDAEDRKAAQSASHRNVVGHLTLSDPVDWKMPADPRSLARDRYGHFTDLSRLSDADRRRIFLYHLGGLADSDSVAPIVPVPKKTGHTFADGAARAAWEARLHRSVEPDEHAEVAATLFRTGTFSGDIAGQVLEEVRKWCRQEATRRAKLAEDKASSGQHVKPKPNWVRSDEACSRSGLSPDAIRVRANREGWKKTKSGRLWCYPLENLQRAWPHKNFLPNSNVN